MRRYRGPHAGGIWAALAAYLFAGCGAQTQIPVSAISQEWLAVKTPLLSGPVDTARLLSLLDGFSVSLAAFASSPLGRLYQTQPFDPGFKMESFHASLGETIEALKTALQRGETEAAFSRTADIDAALVHLQQMDYLAAASVHEAYFRLFLFFSILIITAILLLAIVYREKEKAQGREWQSRSFSRETALIQERERARIARELHDSVAHDLWRLSLHTGGIERAGSKDERRRLCAELETGHKALLEQVRSICDDLVPPDFQHQGLALALRRLCRDFERRSGIECRISIQENLCLEPLDPQLQMQCFRLVQEALANIEKHSGSPEAVVVVRNGNAGGTPVLLICVSDSGRGFEPQDDDFRCFAAEGHFGIRNMYERAAIVGGKLTIDSETGEGATITLEVPLAPPLKNSLTDVGGGGGGGVDGLYFVDRRSPSGAGRNRKAA